MRIGLGLSLTQSSPPPSEGGGGEGWEPPSGSIAAANFASGAFFIDGSPCAIGDLFTGPHFDPVQIGESGIIITSDSAGEFASPNIPLFSAALLAKIAPGNCSILMKIKGATAGAAARCFALIDGPDYNNANTELEVFRQTAFTRLKMEDWLDISFSTANASWPNDTDVIVGVTLWKPNGGDFDMILAINGVAADTYTTSINPSWDSGALGVTLDFNDPQGAGVADGTIIEWFAVVPAKTQAELLTLTTP